MYSLAIEFGLPEEVLPTVERVVSSVFGYKCDASGGFGARDAGGSHENVCSSLATDQRGSAQETCSWAGLDEYSALVQEHEANVQRITELNGNMSLSVVASRAKAEQDYLSDVDAWDRRYENVTRFRVPVPVPEDSILSAIHRTSLTVFLRPRPFFFSGKREISRASFLS